ncbi:glycoside hydrolase family 32 protein [Clostridium sp.]|uniref:glycoside hydrolase family 32 protein n=1 Tax=Clostridium sp. TaxID=1506 RepID=UPI003F32062A
MKKKFKEDINKYKEAYLNKVQNDKWRSEYHLMAPIGWINDPNGLCYFKGKYHVYYQYSPLNPSGGLKFWGHYTSEDLVNWKEEDIALYPDHDCDKDGVYSGSAFVKEDEIYFFYTGNVKHEGEHDYILSGREQNVILVTSKDGVNFSEKYILLRNSNFPGNMSLHVRDPKVWEEDGTYFMVLGARGKDNKGYILIYKSNDLYNWSLQSEPIGGSDEMGYMWECPDILDFNGEKVLIFSPQGIEAKGYDYNNVYQSGYIVGDIEKRSSLEHFVELDRGFDFYAPQTFKNHDGRIIMIGWMGVPDAMEHKNPTVENYWQHQLTIPRELSLINGVIYQEPVRELQFLRKRMIEKIGIDIKEKKVIDLFNSNKYELFLECGSCEIVEINLREDCKISFKNKVFTLSLGKSGYGRDGRSIKINALNNIRIFSDNSSLEIFINDGMYVLSTRVYNEDIDKLLTIEGVGKINIDKWDL